MDVEGLVQVEVEGVLEELGLWKKKKPVVINEPPQNRFWLHDTPGAINDAQVMGGPLSISVGCWPLIICRFLRCQVMMFIFSADQLLDD